MGQYLLLETDTDSEPESETDADTDADTDDGNNESGVLDESSLANDLHASSFFWIRLFCSTSGSKCLLLC